MQTHYQAWIATKHPAVMPYLCIAVAVQFHLSSLSHVLTVGQLLTAHIFVPNSNWPFGTPPPPGPSLAAPPSLATAG